MSSDPKHNVKRHSERQFQEQSEINRVLDNQYVAHVGFIDPDTESPYVIPMGLHETTIESCSMDPLALAS
jgi:uncharacterized protein